jgi:hypothetical protein
VVDRIEELHEDDGGWDGFGEHVWELANGEELLEYRAAWFCDYSPSEYGKESYAIFLRSSSTRNLGAGVFSARRPKGVGIPTGDEFNALHRVAEKLGIEEPEFDFLTVVSYG